MSKVIRISDNDLLNLQKIHQLRVSIIRHEYQKDPERVNRELMLEKRNFGEESDLISLAICSTLVSLEHQLKDEMKYFPEGYER